MGIAAFLIRTTFRNPMETRPYQIRLHSVRTLPTIYEEDETDHNNETDGINGGDFSAEVSASESISSFQRLNWIKIHLKYRLNLFKFIHHLIFESLNFPENRTEEPLHSTNFLFHLFFIVKDLLSLLIEYFYK